MKVFFNVRTSSRERMWDTAREARRVCQPVLPDIQQRTSIARSAIRRQNSFTLWLRIRRIAFLVAPLLNRQPVETTTGDIDLVYTWGAVPKKNTTPYIVEFDNPFSIAYYKQWLFALRRGRIIRLLKRATCVTFMSHTARNHMLELLGSDMEQHFKVLPPFMDHNYRKVKRRSDGTIRFLFVGLGFRRKGGPELLAAFSALKEPQARLTVIAPVDDVTKAQYQHDTRITFLEPQPRERLFAEFYPTHDVFVLPSLLETLGVVILEALSFGMGIITTDLYATPEMVTDGKNGRLLPHPFLQPTKLHGVPTIDCVSIPRETFSRRFLNNTPCYDTLVANLHQALEQGVREYTMWQSQSVEHFINQYAPERWEQRLTDILHNT